MSNFYIRFTMSVFLREVCLIFVLNKWSTMCGVAVILCLMLSSFLCRLGCVVLALQVV